MHGIVDPVERLTEVGRNAADMPTETKSDIFDCRSSDLEAESGGDASGMRHQAVDGFGNNGSGQGRLDNRPCTWCLARGGP